MDHITDYLVISCNASECNVSSLAPYHCERKQVAILQTQVIESIRMKPFWTASDWEKRLATQAAAAPRVCGETIYTGAQTPGSERWQE